MFNFKPLRISPLFKAVQFSEWLRTSVSRNSLSKWPEAHFQGQLGPLPWVSPPKGVAVWSGGRPEMEAGHMLGRAPALQNGAGGGKGIGLVPSSGFHLYPSPGLACVSEYGNY